MTLRRHSFVGKCPSALLRSQSLFIEIHTNLTLTSKGESTPPATTGWLVVNQSYYVYFQLSSNNNYEGSTPAQNPLARKRRSVTASFGHYHRSGSTNVVPELHGKNSHVDPDLSCRQNLTCWQIRQWNILSTKFRQNIFGSICLVLDLHAYRSGSRWFSQSCRSGSTWLDFHVDPDLWLDFHVDPDL